MSVLAETIARSIKPMVVNRADSTLLSLNNAKHFAGGRKATAEGTRALEQISWSGGDGAMRVIDPGHAYGLQELDAPVVGMERVLVFVKREGEKYPGNVGHHSGTNCQEVLRAVFDRLGYLDRQIEDSRNQKCRYLIAEAIELLEARAADRHGRVRPTRIEAVANKTCDKCGHVGCDGGCHAGERR